MGWGLGAMEVAKMCVAKLRRWQKLWQKCVGDGKNQTYVPWHQIESKKKKSTSVAFIELVM